MSNKNYSNLVGGALVSQYRTAIKEKFYANYLVQSNFRDQKTDM